MAGTYAGADPYKNWDPSSGTNPPAGWTPPNKGGGPASGTAGNSKTPLKKSTTKTSSGDWTETSEFGTSLGEDLAEREKYNALAQQRQLAALQSLMGSSGGAGADRISRGDGAIGEKEQAGRAASFARAKDQAGMAARQALTGLQDYATDKGLGAGSTWEAAQAGNIIGGAGGSLGELARDQAMSDVEHAGQVADLEFTGGITQRGQDLQRQQSIMGLLNSLGVIY